MKNKSVRLSSDIVPTKYYITLKPDLKAFVFEGEETIELKLKESTKRITLHSVELDIESAEFMHQKKEIWAGKVSYNKKTETATITFDKALPKGKGKIKVVFRGLLNDHMIGFYRSSYKDSRGRQKHLATTQFEATDARRAFPCFDEPAKKAIFEVSLVVPKNLKTISNTLPIKIREHSEGYKIVRFSPTPKMSTYLLAFIVGDLEFMQGKTSQGVQVRVFTTPGKQKQARFALKTSIKMLEFYNAYFGIKYPLNTLDLIAVPDFSHGAMENWGAITYRETALLIDEQNSSAQSKQYVALVIAHELAHQWFGNLVTMEWWTHLWLNEGFASFIEYLAIDHVFPKWDIWTQFSYFDQGVALKLDGFKNTHPVEVNVYHPNEINEIFDAISYSKGASIIRMLHGYLGEKDFRKGLKDYLKRYSYKNATTEQLWESFEKISGKPIKKIMDNWVKKEGYPLIKLEITNNKLQTLRISQKRFYSSAKSRAKSKDKTLWNIPVEFLTNIQTSKHPNILLNKKSETLNLPENLKWVKVNPKETGFYRVDYDIFLLEKLLEPIKEKKIEPIDRLGIIRDSFASSFSGKMSVTEIFRLCLFYRNEDNYTVWIKLISDLGELSQLIMDKETQENFKNWHRLFLSGIHRKLGWKKQKREIHTDTLLRSLIIRELGTSGEPKVLEKSKKLFHNHLKGKKINANIRGAVYSIVAENGGIKEYNELVRLFKETELQEEQRRIMAALAQFKNPSLIKKALNFSVSRNVRAQDSPLMLAALAANRSARDLSWEFIKKNWELLEHRYAVGGHMINRVIQPFWHFNDQKKYTDVKSFFQKNKLLGINRTVQQILEKINSNIVWISKNQKDIEKCLKHFNK